MSDNNIMAVGFADEKPSVAVGASIQGACQECHGHGRLQLRDAVFIRDNRGREGMIRSWAELRQECLGSCVEAVRLDAPGRGPSSLGR
jgi:excinuclease UvrABC ATPase subunit